nr:unnamed protein product [Digitaria exilis]
MARRNKSIDDDEPSWPHVVYIPNVAASPPFAFRYRVEIFGDECVLYSSESRALLVVDHVVVAGFVHCGSQPRHNMNETRSPDVIMRAWLKVAPGARTDSSAKERPPAGLGKALHASCTDAPQQQQRLHRAARRARPSARHPCWLTRRPHPHPWCLHLTAIVVGPNITPELRAPLRREGSEEAGRHKPSRKARPAAGAANTSTRPTYYLLFPRTAGVKQVHLAASFYYDVYLRAILYHWRACALRAMPLTIFAVLRCVYSFVYVRLVRLASSSAAPRAPVVSRTCQDWFVARSLLVNGLVELSSSTRDEANEEELWSVDLPSITTCTTSSTPVWKKGRENIAVNVRGLTPILLDPSLPSSQSDSVPSEARENHVKKKVEEGEVQHHPEAQLQNQAHLLCNVLTTEPWIHCLKYCSSVPVLEHPIQQPNLVMLQGSPSTWER